MGRKNSYEHATAIFIDNTSNHFNTIFQVHLVVS